MQEMLCADPQHSTRVGQPGFQDVVAIRTDLDGPPIPDVGGQMCEACRIANIVPPAPFDPDVELDQIAAVLGTTRDKLVRALKHAQTLSVVADRK